MNQDKLEKVYSPDIKPYSFEGRSGLFGTLLSFIMAPIRIVTRVMHNIFVIPANLLEGFAMKWFYVSIVLLVIGLADLFLQKKWPLAVSQLPGIYLSLRLAKQARNSTEIAREKPEVSIDIEQVTQECNKVLKDFDDILEGK